MAPKAVPESGWTPIAGLPNIGGEGQMFLSGDTAGNRLRVAYFLREADQVVCARAWFGWAAEGPPGHAHGGSIATVFDEAMGIAALCAGHLVVLASITVQFRKKLPLGTDTVLEARVTRTERRKVYAQAILRDQENERLFAEAEGLYIMQTLEQFGPGKALPDSFTGYPRP